MNPKQVNLNDLPDLAFEKILGYLPLQDRLRTRAVSRRWRKTIDSFVVKSLCYSNFRRGAIREKRRWISGAFARNFICSPGFGPFFQTFGRSILAKLKHLRLCELDLNVEDKAAFVQTLKSFGQLEVLDIIRFSFLNPIRTLELNLPTINSIHVENCFGLAKLKVDAPKLQNVKIWSCYLLKLDLVHAESVQRLTTDELKCTALNKLKSLKYLCSISHYTFDPKLLATLEHLTEIDLNQTDKLSELLRQKQQSNRTDLSVYLNGYLLTGPDDPAIRSVSYLNGEETLAYLAGNTTRLAELIPMRHELNYRAIQKIASGMEMTVLSRLPDLYRIRVDDPVQDIERFLGLLKSLEHINNLWFVSDQSQELFDRLPDYCAIQDLTIDVAPQNLAFLAKLQDLIQLNVRCEIAIDAESICKVLELEFLSGFNFDSNGHRVSIDVGHPKEFNVSVNFSKKGLLLDLNAAIQFIFDNTVQRRN